MLLAGDVGGTKTLVGLFGDARPRPEALAVATFATSDLPDLESAVTRLLASQHVDPRQIAAAAFGVAGPVENGRASLTNVGWPVDGAALSTRLGIAPVLVVNDLVAMAHGVTVLEPEELHILQRGRADAAGNAALIAAGTGLGQALLHRVGGRLIPSPTEGGHAEFAARTDAEWRLVVALRRRFGRVDCERVVSGPGLVNIHGVLHEGAPCEAMPGTAPFGAADVSSAAVERRCPRCVEALDLFVEAYGAAAGDLALRCMATAGVFVGGGIAPKILAALESGRFLDAFRAKAPMDGLVARVPVSVILNERVGLVGAAVAAASLRRERAPQNRLA